MVLTIGREHARAGVSLVVYPRKRNHMTDILSVTPLGTPPWPTLSPFLFLAHHRDHYPAGNPQMGPVASLAGRNLGMDFSGKDGWSMYHGRQVPGFPQHPHRGFETVTIARQGLIDHSDNLGASGRFGAGDCQWMTAGRGIVHCEMFPLVHEQKDNPTELFQIWLNLPRSDKMVNPYFTMLWRHQIPVIRVEDAAGRATVVSVYAGEYNGHLPPKPPPNSWAAREDAGVAIWSLKLEKHAAFTLPAGPQQAGRMLYVFRGDGLQVAGRQIGVPHGIALRPGAAVELVAGTSEAEILMLQGRAIDEPVVQHGPFVMNTTGEIRQAIHDYQRTRFGGWPWDMDDPVHPRARGRFASYAEGPTEIPPE